MSLEAKSMTNRKLWFDEVLFAGWAPNIYNGICRIMRNRKDHYICPLDLYRISSIFYSMIDCDSQCGLWGIVYLFIHALLVACGKFVFSAMTWCCFSCEIWSAVHHGGCENCRRQKMLLAQLPPPFRRHFSSGLEYNCTAVRQSI